MTQRAVHFQAMTKRLGHPQRGVSVAAKNYLPWWYSDKWLDTR